MGKAVTLHEIFAGIDQARIAVIGDFCLDMYWMADMRRSQLSRETPHFPLPVTEERMSPGAAGNVVCNIAALKPASVAAFGVLGPDWRGHALRQLLKDAGAETAGLLECPGRVTTAYCKPLRKGFSDVVYEDPRLDFENSEPVSPDVQEQLLAQVSASGADIICVCDQLDQGVVGSVLREGLCQLGRQGKRILVDSRDRIGLYHHVIVKPNEVEAARAAQAGSDYTAIARALSQKNDRPALVTLGEQGCLVCEEGQVTPVPARKVAPPVDICGAGDTFLSALACALAAGSTLREAAWFANTASAVTIRKIHVTGTASRAEMEAIWD